MKIGAYLAVPYSHPDPAIQQWRFERVTEATALVIRSGIDCVYSPITHSHPIDKHLTERQTDHAFWVDRFDLPFLENSGRLIVLMLPGWNDSVGVKMEIRRAKKLGLPIDYVMPIYDVMHRVADLHWMPSAPPAGM